MSDSNVEKVKLPPNVLIQNELVADFILENAKLSLAVKDCGDIKEDIETPLAQLILHFGLKKYPNSDAFYPEAYFTLIGEAPTHEGVNFLKVAKKYKAGPMTKVEKPSFNFV